MDPEEETARQSLDTSQESTREALCRLVIPGISHLCENADEEWFDFHVVDDRDGGCRLLEANRSDYSRSQEIYRYFRPGNPPSANVTVNTPIYVPGCDPAAESSVREFNEGFKSLSGADWRASGRITSDREGLHIGDILLVRDNGA